MKSISICIIKTMGLADFTVLPYHNNIPTLGEWGWCLGMRKEVVSNDTLKTKVMEIELPPPPTKYLNRDAIISMVNFGKGVLEKKDKLKVNTVLDPILVKYYKKGTWDVY